MRYAQVSDLVTRFGQREIMQLTDRSTPPADAIDAGVAGQALDSASAVMDGYIAAKYTLPLAEPLSPVLVEICADLARYRLYADQPTDIVKQRNDAGIAMLRDIASGRVKIDAAGNEPPPRVDVIEVSGPERRTGRDNLRRF